MNTMSRLLLSALILISVIDTPRIASAAGQAQRQWQIVNPGRNYNSISFEVRGLNGYGQSDAWEDQTPLISGHLGPGQQSTLSCDGWMALDVKFHLNTEDYIQ